MIHSWLNNESSGLSPSSRRAWVEISQISAPSRNTQVALLAEGVGRNRSIAHGVNVVVVVALLAEGVGRNLFESGLAENSESPSSRRAWVEIALRICNII